MTEDFAAIDGSVPAGAELNEASAVPAAEQAATPGEAPPTAESVAEPEPELDPTGKTCRQLILEHLGDCVDAGPQSTASIIAALKAVGIAENTIEVNLSRTTAAGLIVRTSPGHYTLAPKPPPSPPRAGHTDEEWLALIAAWRANPDSWNTERDGAPPSDPTNRIPPGLIARFKLEEQREAEKAAKAAERKAAADKIAAQQNISDSALLDRLLAATGHNCTYGPQLRDVRPIRMLFSVGVTLDDVLGALASKINRPSPHYGPPPLRDWCEPRLLRAVAENVLRRKVVPRIVEGWIAKLAPKPDERSFAHLTVERLQKAAAAHNAKLAAAAAPGEPVEAPTPAAAVAAPPTQEDAPAKPVSSGDTGLSPAAAASPRGAPRSQKASGK